MSLTVERCVWSIMLICYICGVNVTCSLSQFKAHLQQQSGIGELNLPIKCCQPGCKSSFFKIYNFVCHISTFHFNELSNTVQTINSLNVHGGDESNKFPSLTQFNPVSGQHLALSSGMEDLRVEGISLVSMLHSRGSIPYSVIPEVVSSFNCMTNSLLKQVDVEIVNILRDSNVDASVISKTSETVTAHLASSSFLETSYKQDKFFDQHQLAVKPVTVILGSRYETSDGKSRLVYDTFEYVSVESTIRSLLCNENYASVTLKPKTNSEVLSDFRDGLTFRQHPLFSDPSKVSIVLQIFYDGMGTSNPLRGQSSMLNAGVFYYVIQNLPLMYYSCHANVHLLAICYSADLKTYGFEPILDKFAQEMKVLTSTGMSGTFPVLGDRTIYVNLGQVCGNNLALNGIVGFIECFSADFSAQCASQLKRKFKKSSMKRIFSFELLKNMKRI